MPVVPVVDENLRVNTGSPVPIGGTEQMRAKGEAVARLGQALNNLGEENLRQSRERDKFVAADAQAAWENEMLKIKENISRQGPVPGDTDGSLTMKAIEEQGLAAADKIREKLPQNASNLFTAAINQEYVNRYRPGMYIETSKALEAQKEVARNQMINSFGSLAAANPWEIQGFVVELQGKIMGDTSLPLDKRAELAQKAGDNMVNSAMESFRVNKKYGEGKEFLEQFGNLISPENRVKWGEILRDTEREELRFKWSVEDRDRMERERREEDTSKAALRALTAQYQSAPDETTRRTIVEQGYDAYGAGVLRQQEFNQLVTWDRDKAMRTDDVALFGSQVMNDLVLERNGMNAAKARRWVGHNAFGPAPTIDPESGMKFLQYIDSFERSKNSYNPMLGKPLGEAIKMVRTHGLPETVFEKAMTGFHPNPAEKARRDRLVMRLTDYALRGQNPLNYVEGMISGSEGVRSARPAFMGSPPPTNIANDPKALAKYYYEKRQRKEIDQRTYDNMLRDARALEERQKKKAQDTESAREIREQQQEEKTKQQQQQGQGSAAPVNPNIRRRGQ